LSPHKTIIIFGGPSHYKSKSAKEIWSWVKADLPYRLKTSGPTHPLTHIHNIKDQQISQLDLPRPEYPANHTQSMSATCEGGKHWNESKRGVLIGKHTNINTQPTGREKWGAERSAGRDYLSNTIELAWFMSKKW